MIKSTLITAAILLLFVVLTVIMTVLYIGKSKDFREKSRYADDITIKYSRLLEAYSVDTTYYIDHSDSLIRENKTLKARLAQQVPEKLRIVYRKDTTVMIDTNLWQQYIPLTSYTDSVSDDAITIRWRNIILGDLVSQDISYTIKEKVTESQNIVYRDVPAEVKKKSQLFIAAGIASDISLGVGLDFIMKHGQGLGAEVWYNPETNRYVIGARFIQQIF